MDVEKKFYKKKIFDYMEYGKQVFQQLNILKNNDCKIFLYDDNKIKISSKLKAK